MAKPIRILSIDGGGIRGVMPAIILGEIEKRTGRSISDLFDLIAGTSAGGIIALALTKPGQNGRPQYSVKEVIDLFEGRREQLFHRSLWHRIQSVGNLAEVKYSSESIRQVMIDFFGETKLSEAVTDVLIPSYEIEQQEPFIFQRDRARRDQAADFLMSDAALATSAAPTYYEPHKIETDDLLGYRALVDGLVFASNPTLCAYAEAKSIHPENDDFIIVSLGTGEPPHRHVYDDIKNWGSVKWAQPLLDIVLYGSMMVVDYQIRQLLPPVNGVPRYFRFQPKLGSTETMMDNIEASNIRMLKLLVEELIKSEKEQFETVCKRLTESN